VVHRHLAGVRRVAGRQHGAEPPAPRSVFGPTAGHGRRPLVAGDVTAAFRVVLVHHGDDVLVGRVHAERAQRHVQVSDVHPVAAAVAEHGEGRARLGQQFLG